MNRLSEEELEELLSHGSWIKPLARRLLYDPSAADDVVQEVYLTAMRRPPRDAAALPAWLHKVTRTLSFRANRSVRRRRRHELQAPPPRVQITPEQIEQESETQSIVAAEIAKLDEPFRTVVYLRFYENHKFDHIADQLGIPSSTVRNHSQRATQLLRTRLESRLGKKHLLIALTGVLATSGWAAGASLPYFNDEDSDGLDPFDGPDPAMRSATGALAAAAIALCLGLVAWWGLGTPEKRQDSRSARTAPLDRASLGPTASSVGTGAASIEPSTEPVGSTTVAPPNSATPAERAPAKTMDAATVGAVPPVEARGAVVVLDPRGKPVAGAHVALFTRDQPTPEVLRVTDGAGVARVPRSSLTQDRLVVVAPASLEYREPLSRRTLIDDTYTVELLAPRKITVRVVDREGRPIAGAQIDWLPHPPFAPSSQPDTGGASAATDGRGEAIFTQEFLRNEVRVSAPGFEPSIAWSRAPLTEITLVAGRPLRGRLVDRDGVGVAHCAVRMHGDSAETATTAAIPRRFESDAEGFIDFGVVAPDCERVIEFFPIDLPSARVIEPPPPAGVWEFQLPDGVTLEGTVFGPDGETVERGFVFFALPEAPKAQPTENAPTRLNTPAAGSAPARHRLLPKVRARIGADGRYSLGPVPAELAHSGFLFVSHPTLENQLCGWPRGNPDEECDLQLARGTSLVGHAATIEGEAAAGATLFLGEVWSFDSRDPPIEFENVVGRARVTTDGGFRFEGVPTKVSESIARATVAGHGSFEQSPFGATRKRVFLKAFRPDVLLQVEGGEPLGSVIRDGFGVDPARANELHLTVGAAAQIEEYPFALTTWDGSALGDWLPALRISAEGDAQWGTIGSAGSGSRLYCAEATAGRAEVLLVASDRFGWLTIPARTTATQVLRERLASGTQIEVQDGAELETPLHLYIGVTFDAVQPTHALLLGTTDAAGILAVDAIAHGRGTLFAAPVTEAAPRRVREITVESDSPDRAARLSPLGTVEFRPGSRWTLILPSAELTR